MPEQYEMDDIQGLVFGENMDIALMLLTSTGGVKHNYFMLDGNYDSFHFLTSDRRGEILLKLLCNFEKRENLNRLLSQNLQEAEPGLIIENDGLDNESNPVMFAYDFDMPRIKRFTTALQIHGKTGTLICFDFQVEVLQKYCGEQVLIQTIDFEKFEKNFNFI